MKINVCPGDDLQMFYPSPKQTDRTCWMIHAGGGYPQTNSEAVGQLRSETSYTDQNFKENSHFGALNETSVNLEDLDVDFVLQHFV